jgi:hypothetical protein
MKNLLIAAAFVLALAGAQSVMQDPNPSCPPACDDGGQAFAHVR